MHNWGERLQKVMKEKHISKSYALAVQLGVAESTISRWKQSGPISLDKAIQLCEALDVSMDWLFAGRTNADIRETSQNPNHKELIYRKIDELPNCTVSALAELLDSITFK